MEGFDDNAAAGSVDGPATEEAEVSIQAEREEGQEKRERAEVVESQERGRSKGLREGRES